jgi:WD40 repeat protein
VALVLCALAGRPALGQDEVRNFRKPILVVETEGHHAPVRSLVWRSPFSLVSAGQDKVAKVWDFRDGPRLLRTIRPMIWRGPVGVIYALALAGRPGVPGESMLAVAGFGVESRRGDITVYRISNQPGAPTGDVLARLMPPATDQALGHRDSVLALAFDPSGRTLASAGNDRTVVLWDATRTVNLNGTTSFRPLRALTGHTGPIRGLAFLPPDGSRLVTISEDGTARLWDVARGVELDRLAGNPQRPVIINALAVSPDGQTIVIGRENGDLFRLDARSLSRIAPARLPTVAGQGSVEALAYHPDGRRLAVSLKSDRRDTLDPMTLTSDLEIRTMPAGAVTFRRRVPGLVQACAFSPDGTRLAYSGGMDQAVDVQELANLAGAPLELKGQGSTLFDLGFGPGDQVIGFTREFDPARPPQVYEGFDLARRRTTTVSRDALRRALRTFEGWTLAGSINQYRLDAVGPNGQRWRFDLDPLKEGLWWSSTFIPPGPGHPRATVAVGCTAGVAVFDLQTGRRTRFYAGHSGPVVSLVPSRDGHWLASSSVDQTLMLYPLAGCDTRPPLGATFRREADGGTTVAQVAPRSFAAAMGLLAGDRIVESFASTRTSAASGLPTSRTQTFKTAQEIAEFTTRVADEFEPNDAIGVRVQRTVLAPLVGRVGYIAALPSTKRDNPAMTLMQDVGREWVLWTPQGYYDTSIEGDSRLLGWHLNPPYDQTRPTDFVPVGTFARTMYRPEVLDRLWTTRSLDQARATLPAGTVAPEQEAAGEQPPRIAFAPVGPDVVPDAGQVWVSRVANPTIRLQIASQGGSRIAARNVVFNERVLRPSQRIEPAAAYQEDLRVDLPPNQRVRLVVTAANEQDRPRTEAIDLEYRVAQPPPPAPAQTRPRLFVLALGVDGFPSEALPPVPFGERDGEALAGFLANHLVASDGLRPDAGLPSGPTVLSGKQAAARSVREALDQLAARLNAKELRPGDVVAVAVVSHALRLANGDPPVIAAADASLGNPTDTTIPAQDLAELLGQVADYGCRPVLFLDTVHPGTLPPKLSNDIKAWVRDLRQNRRVTTFVAAKEGAAGVSARDRHGFFTLAVLNAFQAAGATSARTQRTAALSLDQFRKAVVQGVLNLSNRQQEAGCYIPRGVQPWTPFAVP